MNQDLTPSALKPTITHEPQAPAALFFNIDDFADVPTCVYVVKNPSTRRPTAATITLAGPEHPERRRWALERNRKIRAEIALTGKMPVGDPAEELIEETRNLADWTLGWENIAFGGQAITYSREAALKLYSDPERQWLRAQVKAAVDERELFIRTSAAS